MLKIDRTNRHGAFMSMDESNGEYKGGFLSLSNPLVIEALAGKKEDPAPEPAPEPSEAIQELAPTPEAEAPQNKRRKKGNRK